MERSSAEMRAGAVSATGPTAERIRETDRRCPIRQPSALRLSARLPVARHQSQSALQRARLLAGRGTDL